MKSGTRTELLDDEDLLHGIDIVSTSDKLEEDKLP